MADRRVLLVDLDESGANAARLWALAEQAWTAHGIAPMVFSSRPGVHLAFRAGYHCEYFPCHTTNGFDRAIWNRWLERRILLLCAAFRFDWIVYVGDRPPTGLLAALDGISGAAFVWIGSEADSDVAIEADVLVQFDRRFEESRLPRRGGRRSRRGDPVLPPIFRRLPGGVRRKAGSEREALFLAGMKNTRFAQRCHDLANDLEARLPGLDLHRQIVDLDSFTVFAAAADERRDAPTPEAVAGLSFVMFEQVDAANLCAVLCAGVPAILLTGDGLGRNRLADYLRLEGLGAVIDVTAPMTRSKANALSRRLAEARRRLASVDIANGAEAFWKALLHPKEGG